MVAKLFTLEEAFKIIRVPAVLESLFSVLVMLTVALEADGAPVDG